MRRSRTVSYVCRAGKNTTSKADVPPRHRPELLVRCGRSAAAAARGRRRIVTMAAVGIATLVLVAGCGAVAGTEAPRSGGSPITGRTGENRVPVDLPDSVVGDRIRWVLSVLSGAEPLTTSSIRENVAPTYLAGTPADRLEVELGGLRTSGPWLPVDVDAVGDDAVVRLEDGSGEPWRLVISTDAAGAVDDVTVGRVTGGPRSEATTWAEVHEQLTGLDADVGLLAAEVTADGRCVPITSIEADRPRPLASVFKLYVLGAVTQAVEDGEIAWSDRLTVTDDVRSLPSGTLQDEPDGTEVSVAQAAAGMIAVSDNTAADMLIDLVGRDAVESAMSQLGHTAPELNDPLLTTREFFTVGWGGGDLRQRWAGAGSAERRDLLGSLPAGPLIVSGRDVDGPAWRSGVDWFGSAEDLCAAQVALHDHPADDADGRMLRTILGHNRGVDVARTTWPHVAFKGGRAPGVLTGAWLAERSDGSRYFLTILAAAGDDAALADHSRVFDLVADAFTLLAER